MAPLTAPLVAQGAPAGWNDPAADSLIARATQRRSLQLADSTLLSYRAEAHGFLAFLAQLGEGTLLPPKVVQSEELALRLAWWQPNRSAQQLVGRRDTLLMPSEVGYYRDRYGVILDNLPDRIRLGDGQDVRDVPHPLAASARALYEFERGTPLKIRLPGREIIVDEVRFRPRDGRQPAAIGSVFLDRESAAVVRLSMTFTRAAILDTRIETLVVTLENTLVRERYWLPRRQEVEVSRGTEWLDIPLRGIVRGHWEIANYDVNERIPVPVQQLPRWSSVSADSLRHYQFPGRVVDVLPSEIQVATPEDVAIARQQAEALVQAAVLAPRSRTALNGRGISDALRFTRAEGLAVGLGLSRRVGESWTLAARARYGFSDRELKGRLAIGHTSALGRTPTVQLFAERELRDLAVAERSGVANSLGAWLVGSDASLQVRTDAVGLLLKRQPRDPFTLRIAAESDAPLALRARPLQGTFPPVIPAWTLRGLRAEVRGIGGWVPADPQGTRGSWEFSTALGHYRGAGPHTGRGTDTLLALWAPTRQTIPLVARVDGWLQITRPLPHDRALVSLTMGGLVAGGTVPPQWLAYAGGPWSAPGYAPGSFATRAFLSQRIEFRQRIPAPAIPLGRFGTAPGHVTLAPFAQLLATDGGRSVLGARTRGLYPSVGTGVLLFFDLVRVDIARGLRDGGWRLSVDMDRGFWGVL